MEPKKLSFASRKAEASNKFILACRTTNARIRIENPLITKIDEEIVKSVTIKIDENLDWILSITHLLNELNVKYLKLEQAVRITTKMRNSQDET